jgi:hypothetical protein
VRKKKAWKVTLMGMFNVAYLGFWYALLGASHGDQGALTEAFHIDLKIYGRKASKALRQVATVNGGNRL